MSSRRGRERVAEPRRGAAEARRRAEGATTAVHSGCAARTPSVGGRVAGRGGEDRPGSTGTRRRRGGRGRGGRGRGEAGGTGGTTTTEEDATSSSSTLVERHAGDRLGDARPAGSRGTETEGDAETTPRRRRRRGGRGRGRGQGGAAAARADAREPAGRRATRQAAAEAADDRRRGSRIGSPSPPRRTRSEQGADPTSEIQTTETPAKASRSRGPRSLEEQVASGGPPRGLRSRSLRGRGRRQREPLVVPPRITDKLMVITEHGDRDQIASSRRRPRPALRRGAAHSMVGNVYLGRIQNVLPGMEAAFVDIGRGRNGVLYAGEVNYSPEDLGGGRRPDRAGPEVGPGRDGPGPTKDPMGGKGARLTARSRSPVGSSSSRPTRTCPASPAGSPRTPAGV